MGMWDVYPEDFKWLVGTVIRLDLPISRKSPKWLNFRGFWTFCEMGESNQISDFTLPTNQSKSSG